MYDIIIIGAGVSGCACARELSRYDAKILVVEKEEDVCCGTSKANSAIVHAGYDAAHGSLMAKLNVEGSRRMPALAKELDFAYDRCGSLVVCLSDEDRPALQKLYENGIANGVPGIRLLSAEETFAMEPNLAPTVVGALYAPSAAIVSPWEFALAMAEVAVRNGVELHRSCPVTRIEKTAGGWALTTPSGIVETRYIINAAGISAQAVHDMAAPHKFTIQPTRGEYYLLDKSEGSRVHHVIFQCPNENGKGVLAGITNISRIDAFEERDGQKVPCEGKLWYRGYNVYDLIRGLRGKRYAFEGAAYLLLLGDLPNKEQLESFTACLAKCRDLPTNFVRDVIMKAPSHDLMNSLTRSVLTLASYDDDIGKTDLQTQLEQCIKLISVFPMLAVYGYHAYNYYECGGSMYIHRPDPSLSTAENLLKMLRPDQKYTDLEAHVLDIALLLHMEHGGGNNSTFTTRVVTSSGSDTYSVIAAALSSLKGPKHGGANIKVMKMMDDIRAHVADPLDEEAMADYLGRIVDRQAFDQKGLIYGMGHAVYSLSDPRAVVFKSFVHQLADAKGRSRDFEYYNTIERLAPQVIAEKRHIYKGVSTNVDFYSGFVYDMLGIPVELYTPIFAVARIVGWSAHRMEELVNVDKIIRPAYQSIMQTREYVPLEER